MKKHSKKWYKLRNSMGRRILLGFRNLIGLGGRIEAVVIAEDILQKVFRNIK